MVLRRPRVILVDYLGTMTIPMLDAARWAVDGLGLGPDQASNALDGLAEYLGRDDTLLHQAERGQVSTEELLDWVDAEHSSLSPLLSPEPPSVLRAPERPEMRQLLVDLAEADEFVMLATNSLEYFQDYLATTYLDTGLVNAVVNSALVGTRKPEREFWQLCVDVAEVDNDEVVLLDDQRSNIESAAEFGMQTIEVGVDALAAIDQLWARLRD